MRVPWRKRKRRLSHCANARPTADHTICFPLYTTLSLSLSLSCSLALSVSPVFRAYYSGLHRVCFRDKKWTFASIYADTTHLLTGAEAAADTATTET